MLVNTWGSINEWNALSAPIQIAAVDLTITVNGLQESSALDSLSSPTINDVTTSSITPAVTTAIDNGIIHMVIVPAGDVPSIAQIKAGQQSNGTAAISAEFNTITSAGVHNFGTAAGLQSGTLYELYFVHINTSAIPSNVVSVGFNTLSTFTWMSSTNSKLFDGIDNVTETGLHWALFDKNIFDVSLLTTVTDRGSNLNITAGTGTLTSTMPAGEYILVIQSPTTNQIGAYIIPLS